MIVKQQQHVGNHLQPPQPSYTSLLPTHIPTFPPPFFPSSLQHPIIPPSQPFLPLPPPLLPPFNTTPTSFNAPLPHMDHPHSSIPFQSSSFYRQGSQKMTRSYGNQGIQRIKERTDEPLSFEAAVEKSVKEQRFQLQPVGLLRLNRRREMLRRGEAERMGLWVKEGRKGGSV